MNKKIMTALILLGLVALVLVYNAIDANRVISVSLLFTTVKALKSLIFLAFIAVGVLIGLLIK
ncbi:MAG: hypothetical protein GX806_00210 [Lentisphaerae bacterium]|nr:hypothetical protein [Lentisphaerota bacterium]